MYIHTFIHTYIHTYIHACTHACIHTCTHAHIEATAEHLKSAEHAWLQSSFARRLLPRLIAKRDYTITADSHPRQSNQGLAVAGEGDGVGDKPAYAIYTHSRGVQGGGEGCQRLAFQGDSEKGVSEKGISDGATAEKEDSNGIHGRGARLVTGVSCCAVRYVRACQLLC